jgi:hypothetical protein
MRRLLILAPVVLVAWFAAAWADGEGRAGTFADAIAPLLEEQTFGLVVIDVTRVDAKAIPEYLLAVSGRPPADARRELAVSIDRFREAGGKKLIAVLNLADMPIGPYLLIPAADESSAEALSKLFKRDESRRARPAPAPVPAGAKAPPRLRPYPSDGPFAVQERVGDLLFVGSEAAWKRLHDAKSAPRPEVAKALAAVDGSEVRAILIPSADTKRAFEENAPTLPKELGGGPITTITRGVQWAALGIDLQPRLRLRLVVRSADAKSARTLADCVESALKELGKNTELRQAFSNYEALIGKLTPEVHGDRLTLDAGESTVAEALKPLVARMTEAASRAQDLNNLKQIGLAMHNYYDVHQSLPPPAIYSKDGKPLLSWRVAILPFLEANSVYKQFHLDEPWDSEHNKALLARMPPYYRSPTRRTPSDKTPYQVLVGDSTLFRGPKGVTFREVTDGLSNTLMVFQTDEAHAIDWTRPDDVREEAGKAPLDAIGRDHKNFVVTLADGSVRWLPTSIDAKLLRALFTRAGGEEINWSKVR